jgi:hypothetical protein
VTVRLLARAWFAVERALCRLPGFKEAYAEAGDRWWQSVERRAGISRLPAAFVTLQHDLLGDLASWAPTGVDNRIAALDDRWWDDYQPYAGVDCACALGQGDWCDECQADPRTCDCVYEAGLDASEAAYDRQREDEHLYGF